MAYDAEGRSGRYRDRDDSTASRDYDRASNQERGRGVRDRDRYRERDDQRQGSGDGSIPRSNRERDHRRRDDGDRFHPYHRSPPRRGADPSANSTKEWDGAQMARPPSPSSSSNDGAAASPPTAPSSAVRKALPLPLSSLAEVARKHADADAAAVKPVFLTRQQREALALQRLEEERQKRAQEREAAQKAVQDLIKPTAPAPPPAPAFQSRDRRDRDPRRTGREPQRSAADVLKEREAALIKAQHLGQRLTDPKSSAAPPRVRLFEVQVQLRLVQPGRHQHGPVRAVREEARGRSAVRPRLRRRSRPQGAAQTARGARGADHAEAAPGRASGPR